MVRQRTELLIILVIVRKQLELHEGQHLDSRWCFYLSFGLNEITVAGRRLGVWMPYNPVWLGVLGLHD